MPLWSCPPCLYQQGAAGPMIKFQIENYMQGFSGQYLQQEQLHSIRKTLYIFETLLACFISCTLVKVDCVANLAPPFSAFIMSDLASKIYRQNSTQVFPILGHGKLEEASKAGIYFFQSTSATSPLQRWLLTWTQASSGSSLHGRCWSQAMPNEILLVCRSLWQGQRRLRFAAPG